MTRVSRSISSLLYLLSMKLRIRKVEPPPGCSSSNNNSCHLTNKNNNSSERKSYLKIKLPHRLINVLIITLNCSIVDAQEFFPDIDLEVLKELYM